MNWLRVYTACSYFTLLGLLSSNYVEWELFRMAFMFLSLLWLISYPIVLIVYLVKKPKHTEISISFTLLGICWLIILLFIVLLILIFDDSQMP